MREFADEFGFTVGAQNFAVPIKNGAMTGEINDEMLKELGVKTVLVGHSERRVYFGETDEIVSIKVQRALGNAITPIICVGETLKDRETGKTKMVLQTQIFAALSRLDENLKKQVIFAYEPVWAIGTGVVASIEQIQETHTFIRSIVGQVPLLYGGSVNDVNCAEITATPNVNGVLVGGASIDVDKFATIINTAGGGA